MGVNLIDHSSSTPSIIHDDNDNDDNDNGNSISRQHTKHRILCSSTKRSQRTTRTPSISFHGRRLFSLCFNLDSRPCDCLCGSKHVCTTAC